MAGLVNRETARGAERAKARIESILCEGYDGNRMTLLQEMYGSNVERLYIYFRSFTFPSAQTRS
jgi:hypothetical protein